MNTPNTSPRSQRSIDFSKIYNKNNKINGKHESIYIYYLILI